MRWGFSAPPSREPFACSVQAALTMAPVALGASNELAAMGARVASLEAALVCGVDRLDSG